MRIILRLQVSILLFAVSAIGWAQELPGSVSRALRQVGIPASAVGAYAQEVVAGRTLVSTNPLVAFSPASTIKLVTTQAALQVLGPTFTWKTAAYASGTQSGDVLSGDLILRGGGDPRLTMESLGLFLRQIREKGIRQIDGDMVLDPRFIADHCDAARERMYVQGSRVLISPDFATQLLERGATEVTWRSPGIERRRNALRLPALSRWYQARSQTLTPTRIKTCNQGWWRSDLLALNGFESVA